MVVFPEAYVCGYPSWIWRLRPGADWDLSERLHGRLLDQAVNIERGDLEPLCEAARRNQVCVMCGMNERDGAPGRATLFNTYVMIGADGEILNRHRKLMPTNPERMVWGFGDGSSLNVVDTPWACRHPDLLGKLHAVGALRPVCAGHRNVCRADLRSGDDWIGTLRHIAREAGCWVVGSGNLLRRQRYARSTSPACGACFTRTRGMGQSWRLGGHRPRWRTGRRSAATEEGILYAGIDGSKRAAMARRTLDVAGHYARPDIFRLHVDTRPQSPVEFQ